jgi:hypothetical protein
MEIKTMDQKQVNPLAKHFRQPAIYLKLPSQGKYWPDGAINMPVSGEIAVYPMTTRDEITLRTPDALINGTGVVEVIQSCCPEIVNAWLMPSIDVDSVIIAIRIASYGNTMNFNSQCPECKNIDDYALGLQNALEQIRMPDYTSPINTEGVRIKLHPQPYFELNRTNQAEFEEQKLLQAIQSTSLSEEQRGIEISNHMNKIIELGYETLTSCTDYIEAGSEQVTDKTFIKEFYQNAHANVNKAVRERLAEINQQGSFKPMHVNCTSCDQPFDIQITFDYAAFFGQGS